MDRFNVYVLFWCSFHYLHLYMDLHYLCLQVAFVCLRRTPEYAYACNSTHASAFWRARRIYAGVFPALDMQVETGNWHVKHYPVEYI